MFCPPDPYEVGLFNIVTDYSHLRKTESNLVDRLLLVDSQRHRFIG